ncbi:MAG: hypothetical protein ACRC9R_08450 [Enterovibrio sp.]
MTTAHKYPPILDILVTDENVSDMLHSEIFRVMKNARGRLEDVLYAIAIGPNAFKALLHWHKSRQTFSMEFTDVPRFHGIRIVCSPLPFAVPLYTERGWFLAHEEAKRLATTENDGSVN